MYENKKEPLAPLNTFYRRVVRNMLYTTLLLALCLMLGVAGYHYTIHLSWIDSLLNASMILSGMGPIETNISTNAGKYFASFYALFSGVAFITNIGVLIAPVAHRFFHKLHLEEAE